MFLLNKIKVVINEIKSPAFKIESEHEDPNTGLIFFWISVKGKCTPPIRKDPVELLQESRSNNCFSEKDYDWIIDNTLENQKRLTENKFKKKLSLVKHQFSGQLEEPMVVYKDVNNQIHIKPAKEIYFTIEKIKQFSSEDSACIGNIVGSYETEQEYKNKKLTNQNKKSNVIKFDTSLLSG